MLFNILNARWKSLEFNLVGAEQKLVGIQALSFAFGQSAEPAQSPSILSIRQ